MKAWVLQGKLSLWSNKYQSKSTACVASDTNRDKYDSVDDTSKETNKVTGKNTLRRRKSDNTYSGANKKELGQSKSFRKSNSSKSNVKVADDLYLADLQILSNSETCFSHNIWYYGTLDICQNNSFSEECLISGTILVRVDRYGSVAYNLTYTVDNEIYTCRFPFEDGKYSLNFDDPTQPKFLSISSLIAYMVENNYLERVAFEWLIENY